MEGMSGTEIDAINIRVEEFKKKKWFKARDVQVADAGWKASRNGRNNKIEDGIEIRV